MAAELEWIKNIAHKIDDENKALIKKYSTLKADFDIQERDKELLMKELLLKKKENAALRSQVEQYEQLLNEVSKEIDHSQPSPSQPEPVPESASKLKTQKSDGDGRRLDSTVAHLNKVIAKEKSKVRELKNMYMREMGSKSELERILRKLVEDVRGSVVEMQKGRHSRRSSSGDLQTEEREQLMERLLANEKVLTLIYDKTFYVGNKQMHEVEMPSELKRILEDNEAEGFD